MIVTVRTRTVGSYFGTVGQLVTVGRRRRVLVESGVVRPYGFDAAARRDAVELAVDRGLTLVDSDGTVILCDGVRIR